MRALIDKALNRGYVLLPLRGTSPPPGRAGLHQALDRASSLGPLPAAIEALPRMTYEQSGARAETTHCRPEHQRRGRRGRWLLRRGSDRQVRLQGAADHLESKHNDTPVRVAKRGCGLAGDVGDGRRHGRVSVSQLAKRRCTPRRGSRLAFAIAWASRARPRGWLSPVGVISAGHQPALGRLLGCGARLLANAGVVPGPIAGPPASELSRRIQRWLPTRQRR